MQLLLKEYSGKVNQTIPTENEPVLVKSQNLSRAEKLRKDENDLSPKGLLLPFMTYSQQLTSFGFSGRSHILYRDGERKRREQRTQEWRRRDDKVMERERIS